VIGLVVDLLINAYGISHDSSRGNSRHLLMPQATLMASVSKSIFTGDLPFDMVAIGMGIAVVIIVLDLLLARFSNQYRIPVLAAALGMYLPFELSGPVVLGGLVISVARFAMSQMKITGATQERNERNGLLFAAGLITGEALVGILLAVPIVLTGNFEFMAVFGNHSDVQWPGFILLTLTMLLLFFIVVGRAAYEDRSYNYNQLL